MGLLDKMQDAQILHGIYLYKKKKPVIYLKFILHFYLLQPATLPLRVHKPHFENSYAGATSEERSDNRVVLHKNNSNPSRQSGSESGKIHRCTKFQLGQLRRYFFLTVAIERGIAILSLGQEIRKTCRRQLPV